MMWYFPIMQPNVLWYGVVRDYEAKTYQVTASFFTSHKRSNTSETRMHYTMCWRYVAYFISIFQSNFSKSFSLKSSR